MAPTSTLEFVSPAATGLLFVPVLALAFVLAAATGLTFVPAGTAELEFVSAGTTRLALVFAGGSGLTALSAKLGPTAAFEFVSDAPATHAGAKAAIPNHTR
jgi:hypothetical protein